jgi:hypothetical protein
LSRIWGRANAPLLFFLLSTRFATSLTFVFRSFSSASRIKREFSGPKQSLSADVDPLSSNILALLLDASTVGTRAEDLSPSTAGFRQASALRQQGNFAEEHAAVALVAAKKNCSVSDKDVVKNRA